MALHRFLRVFVFLPTALAPAALLGLVLLSPTPVAAAQHSVSIVDDAFTPSAITVTVGDTVTWTNNGQDPHTVTADSSAFGSARLDPGASFSFTFTTAGTFAYHCEFHSDMTAQVTVQAAPEAPAPAEAAPAPPAPAADPAVVPATPAHHGTAPAPAADTAAGTGGAPVGAVPTTAVLPEPVSSSTLLVLAGVGIFYTTLVVAIDRASKRT